MKKFGFLVAALAATGLMGGAAQAGNLEDGTLKGPHYTLNVIGMTKAKKSLMTNSHRRTIFVPLVSQNKKDQNNNDIYSIDGTAIVDSQIWLTPGPYFRVCDGNGFDLAYGCPGFEFDEWWNGNYYDSNGNLLGDLSDSPTVSRKQGAVFMLPCNTNTNTTEPCGEPALNYAVYVKAGGKLGGSANVTTCATVDGELVCNSDNTVTIERIKGKNVFEDVTQELTTLTVYFCDGQIIGDPADCDVAGGSVLTTEILPLFATDTEDWFWNYDNNGLRLAQFRFYEIPVL